MKPLKPLLSILTLVLLLFATAAHGKPSALVERQVLAEINLARTNPRAYAGFIKEHRRLYRGNDIVLPDKAVTIRTREGVKAVDEALRFLARQKQLSPLVWSHGLAAAAAELVRDEGPTGDTGHIGAASGTPAQRIERHGTWQVSIAENISYGPDEARRIVMQLIIDDGVADRGHRKNIFAPGFRKAGVACGPHADYGTMCVIDFAGDFKP